MYSPTRSVPLVEPTLTVIPCPKMFVASAILLALASQAFATPIQPRQSFAGDTENGLSGPCKAYTVIFARGTTETGNVGTIAGPPFFQALASRVGSGNLAVQGVNYPADVAGFLAGGDPAGSQTMYGHHPSHCIWSHPANISVAQGVVGKAGVLAVPEHQGCHVGLLAGWPARAQRRRAAAGFGNGQRCCRCDFRRSGCVDAGFSSKDIQTLAWSKANKMHRQWNCGSRCACGENQDHLPRWRQYLPAWRSRSTASPDVRTGCRHSRRLRGVGCCLRRFWLVQVNELRHVDVRKPARSQFCM